MRLFEFMIKTPTYDELYIFVVATDVMEATDIINHKLKMEGYGFKVSTERCIDPKGLLKVHGDQEAGVVEVITV